jgi:hypothetical protein
MSTCTIGIDDMFLFILFTLLFYYFIILLRFLPFFTFFFTFLFNILITFYHENIDNGKCFIAFQFISLFIML